MRSSGRLVVTASALVIAALTPVHAFSQIGTEIETQAGPTTESLHVLGVRAYLMDGTELGDVIDTKIGDHGDVSEVHVAVATPLGLGAKTVAVPIARCITLRGAVIVEMSTSEVAKLPVIESRD